MTLSDLEKRFPSEDACKKYLVTMRWPEGVHCPRCNSEKVHKLSRPWSWQCKQCSKQGYRFSPLVGTIFENTNIPLRTWFQVIYYMCESKKGVSALQIHRMIGTGSYRSAWYMCHRIRAAKQDRQFQQLTGVVEIDETFIGGKAKNRHISKRGRGKGRHEMTPVIGAIARKGNVVAKMVERTDIPTLATFVRQTVSSKVDLVATDEAGEYNVLPFLGFPREFVSHRAKEYVRGNVHTANIDSFWSLIKRGIMGSFHQVSKGYLPLYINEFCFRYNNRNNPAIFDAVIASA